MYLRFQIRRLCLAIIVVMATISVIQPPSIVAEDDVAIDQTLTTKINLADVAKFRIESNLERKLLANSPQIQQLLPQQIASPVAAVEPVVDVRKGFIEKPIEGLVERTEKRPIVQVSQARDETANAVAETPVRSASENPAVENPADDNPQVVPGKVNWHADFAAACQASKNSGKPVLLFQLLGQLDQRFT
jgi:anti-sigma factor RsiW